MLMTFSTVSEYKPFIGKGGRSIDQVLCNIRATDYFVSITEHYKGGVRWVKMIDFSVTYFLNDFKGKFQCSFNFFKAKIYGFQGCARVNHE